MLIEFHSDRGKVHEWVIQFVQQKLIDMHHKNKNIAEADVYFREQADSNGGTKICEIDLTVFGDSVFVSRNADSFELAAREVTEWLEQIVADQVAQQKLPTEAVTSTVKV